MCLELTGKLNMKLKTKTNVIMKRAENEVLHSTLLEQPLIMSLIVLPLPQVSSDKNKSNY